RRADTSIGAVSLCDARESRLSWLLMAIPFEGIHPGANWKQDCAYGDTEVMSPPAPTTKAAPAAVLRAGFRGSGGSDDGTGIHEDQVFGHRPVPDTGSRDGGKRERGIVLHRVGHL